MTSRKSKGSKKRGEEEGSKRQGEEEAEVTQPGQGFPIQTICEECEEGIVESWRKAWRGVQEGGYPRLNPAAEVVRHWQWVMMSNQKEYGLAPYAKLLDADHLSTRKREGHKTRPDMVAKPTAKEDNCWNGTMCHRLTPISSRDREGFKKLAPEKGKLEIYPIVFEADTGSRPS